ncbi:riboflavin synthase [bacterium]|nr:riboflavin synthase [bacterium]
MFTGIIEEIGKIKSFKKDTNGATIEVECSLVLEDTKLGDSIAINGVCQTVIELSSNSFKARVSDETLKVTTFENLKSGDIVNLERALTLNSRLGGHIVSGHVDCKGKFTKIEKLTDFYNLEFEIPQEQTKYVVHKGSITINGISLTVAEINQNRFKVAIIPHTFENTNLKALNVGDNVNIETDILGKYVEKMLSAKDNNSKISMTFLQENGFV